MLKNNFKIAWRSILKNKSLFSINVLGLALGIASCIIIMFYVADELSYDKYHKKADEIHRVVFKANINGESINEAVVMAPVGPSLKDEFPEVEDATRFRDIGNPKVSYNNTSYRNGSFAFVDPNFFEVFTLPIIKGNRESPLSEPNSIVLTQAEAKKYFGNDDPIGKIIELGDEKEQFEVTGIIEKVPNNTHFHFNMFASSLTDSEASKTSWMESRFYTYLVLSKNYDYKKLELKLPSIVEKYMGPQMLESEGMTFTDFTKKNQIGLFLQPLTEIHLDSSFSTRGTNEQSGDIKFVYIFGAIAFFMLFLACINFINLSTASATKRAKEVGIRKVLGSKKKQLISQFLLESLLVTIAATMLAVAMVVFMLPTFNIFSGKELELTQLITPKTVLMVLALIFMISILAGAYPAFYISSFKPIQALKNKLNLNRNNSGLRSSLVVFQFVISSVLILATIVVDQQMSFIQNKNIGYNKDQLLVLRESYFLGNNQTAFKNQISNDHRVAQVSRSAFVPAGDSDNNISMVYADEQSGRRMYVYNIDDQYIPTMDMEILQGRNFSDAYGTDSLSVIINETSSRILDLGATPIGKTISRATNNQGGRETLRVVGMVKDFHYMSLHRKIEPLIMLNNPYGGLIVRAKTSDMSGLIESIASLWSGFNVDEPFSYTVLDDAYNLSYVKEFRTGSILRLFALLTIFVACLGLFGLVTYSAEQRFKEIGIRKVLGSSVSQIVGMLSRDFIKLILISFTIAFPLGYYLMNKWLQDFEYRIDVQWSMILMSGLTILIIAFATISIKSIKAASVNPIKSLKAE